MKTWMNKTLLAVSVQMILGVAYAAEEPSLGGYETVGETVTEQAGSPPNSISPSPAAKTRHCPSIAYAVAG